MKSVIINGNVKTIVKIYALVNSLTNEPFYVGSTIYGLSARLASHKSTDVKRGYGFEKRKLIEEIETKGGKVIIKILEEPFIEDAGRLEKEYYEKFVAQGFNMLQSPSHFNYTEKLKGEWRLK